MKSTFQKYAVLVISVLLLILINTCKKSTTSSKTDDNEGTFINAVAGGTIISPDGLLTLTIPPNSLSADTYINIEVVDEADYPTTLTNAGVVGEVYDIQPDGTVFGIPAQLRFDIPKNEINTIKTNEEYISIGGISLSSDNELTSMDSSNYEIDISTNSGTLTTQINHLSYHTKSRTMYNSNGESYGEVKIDITFGKTECPQAPQLCTVTIINNTSLNLRFKGRLFLPGPHSHEVNLNPGNTYSFVEYWDCHYSGTGLDQFRFSVEIREIRDNFSRVYRRITFNQEVKCCDQDGDGVTDPRDICPGYDDYVDTDGDGIPDGCDICEGHNDNIDTDSDGIPDGCEDGQSDPTICDEDAVFVVDSFFDVFFDINVCGDLTDQVSELPVKYSAKDHPDKDRVKNHTSTYALGAIFLDNIPEAKQNIFNDTWPPNGQPNPTLDYGIFADGFESGDVSAWSSSAGLPKLLSSALNISENSLVFINAMHENIPANDPSNYYQYGFVFDRDGDPSNNYQPHPDFPNDFFKDTDYWVVAWYDPNSGWELVVTDASNGTFVQVASEAQLIFVNNTMILIIPESEFFTNDIGYRMTAFRHTGDWGVGGDWDGDVQPPVADGLRMFSY